MTASLENSENENETFKETISNLSIQVETQESALYTSREEIIALRDELKRTQHILENEKKLCNETKCSNEILSIKVQQITLNCL